MVKHQIRYPEMTDKPFPKAEPVEKGEKACVLSPLAFMPGIRNHLVLPGNGILIRAAGEKSSKPNKYHTPQN